MDQLSKDAVAAQKAGLSYGRYMATKPQKAPAVRYPKKEKKIDEGYRCVNCGMLIPAGVRSKKYCSPECANEMRMQQHNDRRRRNREKERTREQEE